MPHFLAAIFHVFLFFGQIERIALWNFVYNLLKKKVKSTKIHFLI